MSMFNGLGAGGHLGALDHVTAAREYLFLSLMC
jgi:hypothetical protein